MSGSHWIFEWFLWYNVFQKYPDSHSTMTVRIHSVVVKYPYYYRVHWYTLYINLLKGSKMSKNLSTWFMNDPLRPIFVQYWQVMRLWKRSYDQIRDSLLRSKLKKCSISKAKHALNIFTPSYLSCSSLLKAFYLICYHLVLNVRTIIFLFLSQDLRFG